MTTHPPSPDGLNKSVILTAVVTLTCAVIAVVPPIISLFTTQKTALPEAQHGTTVNVLLNYASRWSDGFKIIADRSDIDDTAALPKSESPVGQFRFVFQPAEISPVPGQRANTGLRATVGMEIKNVGKSAVRVAIIPAWPTLQAEGAIAFEVVGQGISGIASFGNPSVSACPAGSGNFSLLRPGQNLNASFLLSTDVGGRDIAKIGWARVSGSLMVQSVDDKTCWVESIASPKIPSTLYK